MELPPEFLPVSGQPSYGVSSGGQVWSIRSGRIISGTLCGQMGYRAIQFPDKTRRYVHRIVCEAFHGPASPGLEVRHLDGTRHNNSAGNLAWGTKQQNEDDRKQHGTTAKGERNPQAKLSRSSVALMRDERRKTGRSYKKIAAQFGVSTMTAFRAITGESWND